jgi:signal peptidase II
LKKALIVIFSVLFLDIFVKVYVKTHFFLGESVYVFGQQWFQINFIENNGMAFGMEFAGGYGKIFLSVFRILASGAIAWYLYTLIKKKANDFLIITIALIFTGAIGNIVDSAFFGLIFNNSPDIRSFYPPPICTFTHHTHDAAVLFPKGGGYSTFLQGRVVDMLYFPIIDTTWPDWVPFWGGKPLKFFEPIFNIADSSITIGVFILLIFQKRLFKPSIIKAEETTLNSGSTNPSTRNE